jgi:hypothetical protein
MVIKKLNSIYLEPIGRLSRENPIAQWSIPAIEKLSLVDEINEDDAVLTLPRVQNSTRIDFLLMLAPWNYVPSVDHFAIRYDNLMTLIVIPINNRQDIPSEYSEHFLTYQPNFGTLPEQALSNETALIEFHQKINNTRDLIVYSPNQDGIYTIITSVEMRTAPRINIIFANPEFSLELVSSKNHVIKFKVKNQFGHTIKQEVEIINITLDSRL